MGFEQLWKITIMTFLLLFKNPQKKHDSNQLFHGKYYCRVRIWHLASCCSIIVKYCKFQDWGGGHTTWVAVVSTLGKYAGVGCRHYCPVSIPPHTLPLGFNEIPYPSYWCRGPYIVRCPKHSKLQGWESAFSLFALSL